MVKKLRIITYYEKKARLSWILGSKIKKIIKFQIRDHEEIKLNKYSFVKRITIKRKE